MQPKDLKTARLQKGWTETRAALRLGVSQSYVSMLEAGERPLTSNLARRVMNLYGLPPTVLPPKEVRTQVDPAALAKELASLGYPGFAYLGSGQKRNPAETLLTVLSQRELEARLVEALPWLVFNYWTMDLDWLVSQARQRNLQNRLGFVVHLARQVADRKNPPNADRSQRLNHLESALEKSRLVHEDTLGKSRLADAEREWLRQNRPEEARHWNLLTDWRADILPYVSQLR